MSRASQVWGVMKVGARCHRIPERCFVVKNWRMPICARCLGASIGHVVSITLAILGNTISPVLGASLVALMLVDWGLQEFFGIMSNNPRRLITGIAGGVGVNSILIWIGITLLRVIA